MNDLTKYILKKLNSGQPAEKIVDVCKRLGWPDSELDAAFSMIHYDKKLKTFKYKKEVI